MDLPNKNLGSDMLQLPPSEKPVHRPNSGGRGLGALV